MDGFNKLPKMQCFKTGGSVKTMCYGGKMKKGGEVDASDIKQDKAIVKKAFKMHDKQEHPGEKTDLSKLRKGGRAKKDCGTVKKYKAGGGVYGAKKTNADIKSIDKAKNFKPEMLCGGKSVKKYSGEYGSHVTPMEQQHSKDRYREKMRLSPSQQLELESQQAAAGAQFTKNEADRLNKVASGIGSKTSNMPSVNEMGDSTGYKRGGKAKKMMTGGTCS